MQIIQSKDVHPLPIRTEYRADYSDGPSVSTALSDLRDVLWAHRELFLVSVLVCFGIAAIFSFTRVAMYRARGSVELQMPAPTSYSSRDGDAQAVTGQSFDAYLEAQMGILESDTLVRKAMQSLNLPERAANQQPHASRATDAEDLLETTKKNLVVHQSRLNNLIEVLYSSEDPRLAADFVNTLVDEYARQNLEARWQMAQSTGTWLTGHLNELRSQLETSETELQNYSRANGLLLVSDKDSVAKERLHNLEEALSRAQSERIIRQSQMEMATSSSPDAVPQVLNDPAVSGYGVKIADLRRQLADYKLIFTPGNTKIQTLESQILSLEAALKQQRSSIVASLRNQYQAALRNEKMLSAEYDSQARMVTEEDEKMVRYETLKHEVDTNRATYASLLQKIKESSVSVGLAASNIRVVDRAVVPSKRYKPNHIIDLSCGLMAGLMLGLTSVAVSNRSRRTIHRSGVLPSYLSARELGVIPSGYGLALRHSSAMEPSSTGGGRDLQTWLEPNSAVSECFRSVMTSILFSTGGASGVQILAVTSSGPNEGKTTIASNLAAAFAIAGRRVLLVDADLRRPRLHSVFKVPVSPGLLEYATEIQARGAAAVGLDDFVRTTPVPGLFFMPSGRVAPAPPSLAFSSRFAEVFSAIRERFDTVVLDVAPLLCASEARVIARLADGVILVVRATTSRVEDVVAAQRYVQDDGGNLLGTVLNDARPTSIPYYGVSTASVSAPQQPS
jgi:succinoglycan biosynthesis transport protein ExoP